jgi:copper chaperone NosL
MTTAITPDRQSLSRARWSIGDRYVLLIAIRVIVFLLGLALCLGCERNSGPQPPVILFGQQECDECRMIISDERYAAAMIIDDGEGDYRSAAFDDVGCLMAHEGAHADRLVVGRYVRDQASRQWLDAESAVYVQSAALETPMAFGIAALASAEAADELASTLAKPSLRLDWTSLRRRFAASLGNRYELDREHRP